MSNIHDILFFDPSFLFQALHVQKRCKIQQKQGQHPSDKLVNTNQSNAITGIAKWTGRVSCLIDAQLTLESSQNNIPICKRITLEAD